MNTPIVKSPASPARSRGTRTGPAALFFLLAGAGALMLEMAWLRLFGIALGTAASAVAPVTAAFLGGLAIGAILGGRVADRGRHPLRSFALAELAAGALSVATLAGFAVAPGVIGGIYRATNGAGAGYGFAGFAIAIAVIGLPCAVMGSALPLLARHAAPDPASSGRPVAILYGVNTLGAVLGVLLAAFVTLEAWGTRATVILGAALLLASGGLAFIAARRDADAASEPASDPAAGRAAPGPRATVDRGTRAALTAVVFLAGFAILALEVLWSRVVFFMIDATVYAFAIMLAVCLAGIGAGSLAAAPLASRARRPFLLLGIVTALAGIAALVSTMTLARWPSLGESIAAMSGHATFLRWNLERALAAIAVVLAPALLLGAVLPLAVRAAARSAGGGGTGRMVGALSAASAAGGVLGALFAGLVFAPLLGTARAQLLVAFLTLLAGLLLVVRNEEAPRRTRITVAVALLVIFLAGRGTLPERPFQSLFSWRDAGAELVDIHETPGAVITVHQYPAIRTLSVNGVTAAGTDLVMSTTQRLQAHLPALLHPAPRTALAIGVGGGETARVLLLHGLERVDAVEIAPGIAAPAARLDERNAAALRDGRLHLVTADGHAWVRYTASRYDLVVNDPTHPALAGAGALFTREHFAACRARLREGGVMATWVPLFALTPADLGTIVRTFSDVFPNATLWYAGNCLNRHALLVGTADDRPLTIEWNALVARMTNPGVAADLAELNLGDPLALLGCYVTDREGFAPLVAQGALNREDRPVLEYRAPRILGRDAEIVANLVETVARLRTPVQPRLAASGGDPAMLEPLLHRSFAATTQVLRGIALDIRGVSSEPERAYRAALAVNPDDRHAKFFLQDKAVQEATLSQAIAANPEDRDTRLELARVLMKQGKFQDALAAFTSAVPERERDAALWYDIGLCQARLGLAAEAEASYRQAIRLDPDLAEPHVNLGALLQRNGRFEDAVAEYKLALDRVPLHPEANYNLGVAYAQKGLHKDAIPLFERAVEARPTYAEAYFNLGISRATTGDLPGAVSAWESCVRIDPSNQTAQANLARARSMMSRTPSGEANPPQNPAPSGR